jgi:protein-S-isoprenylcysteine O-methyltransferase Ste14
MGISIFKIVQLAVLIVLIVFISDFRRKKDMIPLVGEKWTYLLMALCLVPLAFYFHVLFLLSWISVLDILALGITLFGTCLVIQAKRDLSARHTWVGYSLQHTTFAATGIYAYIRHPLYTGIFLVILGSLFTIIPRLDLSLSLAFPAAALVGVSYVLGFLVFLANRETSVLLKKFGSPFQHYKEQVHAFLPLKKYVAPTGK